MNDDRPIVVAVFGLSPREERILQTICFISKTRPRTYELMEPGQTEGPDMALLDGQEPNAVTEWRKFNDKHPMLPLVIVGEAAGLDWPALRIDRPLLATKLLAIFDQIEATGEHPAFAAHKETQGSEASANKDNSTNRFDKNSEANKQNNVQLSALVVDDSLPIRMQMQKELGLFVNTVDLAETGEQALELINKNTYDIIFLDVVLPGMDGYQICKTIKRDKRTKVVPVVMLTGKASPFDRVRGKLAGCDTYLTKPVDLPTFKEVVQQYLVQKVLG